MSNRPARSKAISGLPVTGVTVMMSGIIIGSQAPGSRRHQSVYFGRRHGGAGTRAIPNPTRSNHSTRIREKARSVQREPAPQLERVLAKVKTKSGTHPNLIAKAQAPGQAKLEKDPELKRERERVETNRGTQLSVIFREQKQVTLEQTGTREPEIRITCEPPGETRPKCTPTKEPG